MEIRKATEKDVERLMAIFERAREFMRRTGNMTQWIDGYPSLERVRRDIEEGNCYGVENGEGRVVGTFVAAEGEEPNYREIRDGEWLNDRPYVTIHRLASDGTERGGPTHACAGAWAGGTMSGRTRTGTTGCCCAFCRPTASGVAGLSGWRTGRSG